MIRFTSSGDFAPFHKAGVGGLRPWTEAPRGAACILRILRGEQERGDAELLAAAPSSSVTAAGTLWRLAAAINPVFS